MLGPSNDQDARHLLGIKEDVVGHEGIAHFQGHHGVSTASELDLSGLLVL